MHKSSSLVKMAGLAAVAALAAMPASAQEGADFFNGKTVEYIVATNPGGNYDANGRLVAEFMQKHLPGSTFIVRNMPGAGHMVGTNYVYAAEPDGLTMGTFNTGLIYNQLVGNPGIRFDLEDMSWIGKVSSDPRIVLVSEQSGIESFEELMALEEPIQFAAAGVGSAAYAEATMLINSLNLPVRVITGYDGTEDMLAMMRGEIQGTVASRSAYEQFVADGGGRIIAQIGGTQTDVPQLADLIDSEDGLRAVALIESQGTISRLTAGPPGIPADRLQALRDAYGAATADPEFLARAEQLGLPVDPLVGEDVAAGVREALDQTPEMVDFLRQMLN